MLRFVASLGVLLAGCAGDDVGDGPGSETGTPMPDLDPMIELGSGVEAFLPLTDGGEIVIVQGPQGGHHFDGSLRAQGFPPGDGSDLTDPENPTTTFRVFLEGAQIDVGIVFTQGLEPSSEPGVYEVLGRKVILDIERDDDLDGVEVEFEVEVVDVDGNTYTDRRSLVGVPHPLNSF